MPGPVAYKSYYSVFTDWIGATARAGAAGIDVATTSSVSSPLLFLLLDEGSHSVEQSSFFSSIYCLAA
jgi:hypothetical protein